jgi:hypothetical protein
MANLEKMAKAQDAIRERKMKAQVRLIATLKRTVHNIESMNRLDEIEKRRTIDMLYRTLSGAVDHADHLAKMHQRMTGGGA